MVQELLNSKKENDSDARPIVQERDEAKVEEKKHAQKDALLAQTAEHEQKDKDEDEDVEERYDDVLMASIDAYL